MDYMSSSKSDMKMDLMILNISCSHSNALIKFQGRYISDCEFDYHVLQTEIQLVLKVYEDLDVGQFCLVQDKPLGTWHRGKILDKINQTFEVFLIDQGNVVKVVSQQISSAIGELFNLPPKVVNGIFSNILPVDEKWSSRAIKYFSSLVGQHLSGLIKTILPHQVILLEVPKVINYAIELKLAKFMDSDSFCLLVEIIHNSLGKQMPDLLQQKAPSDISQSLNDNHPRFQKVLDHLRPEISVGTVEKIKISAAVSLDRFYCRILPWEVELHKITFSMCSFYESPKTESNATIGSYGVLCAAKRNDGLWYRGVIQAIISCSELKVWFIDIGSSETIPSMHVCKLQPEFLSLPMMAIPCALSRVNDLDESAKNMQRFMFKEALIGHIVIAHMDQYCSEERLFSISLYEKEYELNADCLLTNQKVPSFSPNAYTDIVKSESVQISQVTAPPPSPISKGVYGDEIISIKSLQMDLDSVHVVYVEYVLNPSNFWVRTDEFHIEFPAMMAEIAEIYNKCDVMEMLIKDPQPGMLCCALYSKDRHYYRAVVTEVINQEISIYFIDFGNTETIPFYDVKVLLPQFNTLPALAMCCTLAYAFPIEDLWIKSANDFFKEIVAGKALLCHVLAKHNLKYVVQMRFSENSENSDVVSVLVQAGYAEFWNIDVNPRSLNTESQLPNSDTKYKHTVCKVKSPIPVENYCTKGDIKVSLHDWTIRTKNTKQKSLFYDPVNMLSSSVSAICYKQYEFKPGTVMFVKCSHMESPDNFWCQLSRNLTTLETVMNEVQTFYKSSNNKYQHGQIACIAKSSRTGKYYRAAIRKQISKNEVDVIFVDFGKVEKVLVSDLREIQPRFLKWEGQAFRCCLSNIFPPCGQHKWSASECKDFKRFFDSTDVFQCTIVALFSFPSGELCNAIDLETPYRNAIVQEKYGLASKGYFGVFEHTVPFVDLHTFCYSRFDLDVGSKENIYITYIYNTGKFYCQLAKNENAFEMLMSKISQIGDKMKPDIWKKVKNLCIVKYIQDGAFYRALAHPVDSVNSLAFFVDFGDSQVVKETELLPIPHEATDVLFEPMQALPCFLSGLKEVPFTMEAKAWFEEQCIDKLLSAAVVSRDDDGQLGLELCSGHISINSEIKKILGVDLLQKNPENEPNAQSHSSQPLICEKSNIQDLKNKTDSHDRSLPMLDLNQNETLSEPKAWCHSSQPTVYEKNNILDLKNKMDSHDRSLPMLGLNETLSDNALSLLHSPQNSLCKVTQKQTLEDVRTFESTNTTNVEAFCSPQSPKKYFKTTELPQLIMETGSTHLVFASYITSPSEFYIQLAKNEKPIMQLEEELNGMSFQPTDVKRLEKGVLVVAQYPDDKAFYRAEIKEMLKGNTFKVEFIDYGNTAVVDCSSIFTLPEAYLNVPRLSISVFLKGFQRRQTCEWNTDVVNKFCEKLTSESFDCMFFCRHADQWEVSINFEGQTEFLSSIVCLPKSGPLDNHLSNSVNPVFLKPGQIEKVKHIYLSDSGMLFVTLVSHSQESKITGHITAALQQITNRLAAREISEGMRCLAKSKKMQSWFRASVVKIFPETLEMSVFFVDHGASEIISMHNAKKLTFTALSIPYQAVACKWIWTEQVEMDLYRGQIQLVLQKNVQVQFIEPLESQHSWKVEILVEGLMLKEFFGAESHEAEKEISIVPSYFHFESNMVSIPRESLKPLEVHAAFVTTFQDPFSFTIQMEKSVDSMNMLSQLIQKLPDELSQLPVDSVRLGSSCLIKSFEDKEWCRADIVSINASSILVNLLDYGVYKSIPYSDCTKLKVISKELACLPSLTYSCKLYGIIPKHGTHWSKRGVNYCLDFVQDYDLLILPIKSNAGVLEVSIYGAGNLAEKLVSKGFATISKSKEDVAGEYENVHLRN